MLRFTLLIIILCLWDLKLIFFLINYPCSLVCTRVFLRMHYPFSIVCSFSTSDPLCLAPDVLDYFFFRYIIPFPWYVKIVLIVTFHIIDHCFSLDALCHIPWRLKRFSSESNIPYPWCGKFFTCIMPFPCNVKWKYWSQKVFNNVEQIVNS